MIPDPSDRDARLADCLDQLADAERQGRGSVMREMIAAHPDLEDELRSLWTLARLTQAEPTRPPAPTLAGLPLLDGYDLLEEIGRGGMGVVYRARQHQPDRIVAIKMILHGDLASTSDLARFRSEPQLLAQLDGHPNLVSVHEVGEIQGRPFFSMRYVEGTTLAQKLADGVFDALQAAKLLATIARAVHHAHAAGVLHRDLKPSNVLLDGQGTPFVSDFGLAKQMDAHGLLTPSHAIVGTPSYIAPELADSKIGAVGPASDVYSLGSIFYEMLTGQPPFRAATHVDTIWRLLQEDPVPVRVLNPAIHPDLEMICLKCLEKSPRARYASAAALADDLEAYARGDAISLSSISLSYFFGHILRDTQHASVLENWGGLWLAHAVKIFTVASITNLMLAYGVDSHLPYLLLWSFSLIAWGVFFWTQRRRGGPVTMVERQMAHAWAAGVAGCISMFAIEWMLNLPVLTLTPGLAVVGGMVFMAKAGMLSGIFYVQALAMFLSVPAMIALPAFAPILFGAVSAACFAVPGWKYLQLRRKGRRA